MSNRMDYYATGLVDHGWKAAERWKSLAACHFGNFLPKKKKIIYNRRRL